MKYVEAKKLLETGLLFETNRTVLHPHGFALAVDDEAGTIVLMKKAEQDKEGLYYALEDFEKYANKFEAYRRGHELTTFQDQRFARLGFVVQEEGVPPEKEPQ